MGEVDAEIRILAESQHGLVARWQLRERGLSDGAIARRIDNERLVWVSRGVFALGHRPAGDRARWMTDVLAFGPRVLLADRSAAQLWGLGVSDRGRTALVGPADGARSRGLVRRTVHPLAGETTNVEGIPVTTVARTLVDLASRCRPAELRRAVEQAEALELFDLRQIEPLLTRRGAKPLRLLLDDAKLHGLPRTRSTLEAEFIEFCGAYGLPRPHVNRWDGAREIDFRWPSHRVVVETDGWEFHRTRAAFERDAARSQALAAEGWTLVRVTWRQVRWDPAPIAAQLRLTLSRATQLGA